MSYGKCNSQDLVLVEEHTALHQKFKKIYSKKLKRKINMMPEGQKLFN
jgi:hypothetical protein